MSSQTRWKLLAVLIVALAIFGAVGWQQFTPQPTQPKTITITPTITTVTGTQATVAPQHQTEWIRIREVKSVDHYLSLLESNGTAPYVQLAQKLRKLPDLTNATAVAKITWLALNATNPEVREAVELMIRGGTPDPRHFAYSVPNWNTELQVLYWLACHNEVRRDDTLALAVALVHGFWITVGNAEVREAVKEDVSGLLAFFRETNQMRRARNFDELESYPLEAKICLAWTASITPNLSALPLIWGVGRNDQFLTKGYVANRTRVTLEGYRWNTVGLATLRTMRDIMDRNGWINKDPSATIPFLEEYFYFSKRHLYGHWEREIVYITVDGRQVPDYTIGNINWQLDFYLRTGNFQGQCTDESQWIDAWAKSWGIATNTIWRGGYDSQGNYLTYVQHFHPLFYVPSPATWRASEIQLDLAKQDAGTNPLFFMIFRPPVDQRSYFSPRARTTFYPHSDWLYGCNPNMFYWHQSKFTLEEIKTTLLKGLTTSTYKQRVMYGEGGANTQPTIWTREAVWNKLPDGSLDLVDENGKIIGDLGQRYVDIASINCSFFRGLLYFRFDLRDKIPSRATTTNVTGVWYQVYLDVDSNSTTGYQLREGFTIDYILQLYIEFDTASQITKASSYVCRYSGIGREEAWTQIPSTKSDATLEGGIGQDFLTIACRYEDISASKGTTGLFMARSRIAYNGKVYYDNAPDNDFISITL